MTIIEKTQLFVLQWLLKRESLAPQLEKQIADTLEHRPELTDRIVGDRLLAYQHLRQLRRILMLFEINLVIDCGAHSGQFASTLYGYSGYTGVIHSYEPVKKYYEIMKFNESFWPGWEVFNYGVSDVSGVVEINLGGNHGGTSSLLKQGANFSQYIPDAQLEGTELIEVRRLDELYSGILSDSSKNIMLKLDVQGFEGRILKSCAVLLDKISLIHVELSSVSLYEQQETFGKLCDWLEQHGFTLINVLNNFGIKNAIYLDYDCVFCKSTMLEKIKA